MLDQINLKTDRLVLRPPQERDASQFQTLASNPLVNVTTMLPHPYDAIERIRNSRTNWEHEEGFMFAIVNAADEAVMGMIDLHPIHSQQAVAGYWLGVPYWNQGYATEALRRVIQFGFEERQLNRIFASHFSNNPASARVMKKADMTFEGTMRHHILKEGEYVDLGFYSVLRAEYEEGL